MAALLTAYPVIVGKGGRATGGGIVSETYLSELLAVSHKVLCDPRIVRDAHAADGKREARAGGDGEGVKARVRVEHDAVDLGVG